jgi:hypothetical protein
MQAYKSLAENIQYSSNNLVGGYPVTNFMMSNGGQSQQGGGDRLKDLVVPLGLVLDNLHVDNYPHYNKKIHSERIENIGVIPDDVFSHLMDTVTFSRNTNAHTKKRLQIKKPSKVTRSRS